jgi:hypothetical protein
VLADAVRQGLALPQSALVALTPATRQFSSVPVVLGLLVPPAYILGTVFFKSSLGMTSERLTRWVDGRWGPGSAGAFLQSFRPIALVGLGAFILGSVGLASSVRANAPPFAFEIASFFLASGIGFGIARIMARRLLPNEPWV